MADVLFAHNDSGDRSRFFAVSRTGADLGVFEVTGAQNVDWEDMDRGPCPAGSCLYIGDIGDNDGSRLAYTVYRMTGPAQVFVLPGALTTGKTLMATRVGEVRPPSGDSRFTGGSIHPDGAAILMRTRKSLFYYPMQPEQRAEEALAGEPCELPVADEMLGEAVTWLPGGAEFVTVGEGASAAISLSSCAQD